MTKLSCEYKIKNNLALIRMNRGYTQEQLAGKCFISCRAYINIENGDSIPNLATALIIAKILKEPLDNLFNIYLESNLAGMILERLEPKYTSKQLQKYKKKYKKNAKH